MWSEPGDHVVITDNFPLGRTTLAPCGPTNGSRVVRLSVLRTGAQVNGTGLGFWLLFANEKSSSLGSWRDKNYWFCIKAKVTGELLERRYLSIDPLRFATTCWLAIPGFCRRQRAPTRREIYTTDRTSVHNVCRPTRALDDSGHRNPTR